MKGSASEGGETFLTHHRRAKKMGGGNFGQLVLSWSAFFKGRYQDNVQIIINHKFMTNTLHFIT